MSQETALGGTSRSGHWGAFGGLLVTTVMWGSMVPVTALLLDVFNPFLLSILRYCAALLALVILQATIERGLTVRGAPWGRLMALGAAMAAFSTFFTFGILFSDPVTAAIILTGGPVIAAIMARLSFRTPFEPGFKLGLLLAVGGGIVVAIGNPNNAGRLPDLQGGEILLILAMTCWTWYTIRCQIWLPGWSQLSVTTLTSATASFCLAFVFGIAWLLGLAHLPAEPVTLPDIALLLWIGIGGGGIAIVLWHIGARQFTVAVAALYLNLVPIIAVLIATALGFQPSWLQLVGGILVLVGVLQIQLRRFITGRTG
ncbi:DMT family transporter [Oceanibacterium hippocampi]|uniref:EamA-like transporter family protein n=1 Tax=Oceanibacterium hippocampi TaxID=745714 RepID=A0A1Y5SB57_9PROT|nr:DMT family transporter [Oceanibacterium hippocampi]SLN35118.1 EamA-like transporter family protein [Oceanibacterium hippocampi]